MPLERIRVSDVFPTTPDVLYAAWIDADRHGEMTGSTATSEPRVGGSYTAWDGYISGKYLTLEPGARVVQSWRTSEFDEHDRDSRLEVLFEADGEGTRVTFVHTNLPDGTGAKYEGGWSEFYIDPMTKFFTK